VGDFLPLAWLIISSKNRGSVGGFQRLLLAWAYFEEDFAMALWEIFFFHLPCDQIAFPKIFVGTVENLFSTRLEIFLFFRKIPWGVAGAFFRSPDLIFQTRQKTSRFEIKKAF
jgi:hypothetical protein